YTRPGLRSFPTDLPPSGPVRRLRVGSRIPGSMTLRRAPSATLAIGRVFVGRLAHLLEPDLFLPGDIIVLGTRRGLFEPGIVRPFPGRTLLDVRQRLVRGRIGGFPRRHFDRRVIVVR